MELYIAVGIMKNQNQFGGYSDGYSGGCFGVGGGFCMSENKADKKLVLIIKRKDSKKNIGDNDIYGGVAY